MRGVLVFTSHTSKWTHMRKQEGVGDEDMEDEEEGEQAWERDRLGLREGECSYGCVWS